jgi:predicted transcriptional regulator
MSHAATNWAIRQRGLKPAAKLVLWHLADCHNPAQGCFPSQDYLADACELSRSSLNDQLAILEERGLIQRNRVIDQKTRKQRPTRYILAFELENPVSEIRTRSQDVDCETQDVVVSESGIRTRKGGEPCPKNAKSRVRNSDTNLVKEPVTSARAREGRYFTADEKAEAKDVVEHLRAGHAVVVGRVPRRVKDCIVTLDMISDAEARQFGIAEKGQER